MDLYVSKTNDKLNTKLLDTENLTDYICLNPKYSNVTISNKNIKVLLDSGAFQDTEDNDRLTPAKALRRQTDFENKLGIVSYRIVAYDYIGNVEETMKANKYIVSLREMLRPRQLVLMVQGNTTEEYVDCLMQVLKIAKPEDCIGLGGVALAGRNDDVKQKLFDVFKICTPILYKNKIKDIHIFGVGTFEVLKQINRIVRLSLHIRNKPVDHFNISCDTAAFEIRSVMGNMINPETEKWEKVYKKDDKYVNYHPCDLTQLNIQRAIAIISRIK